MEETDVPFVVDLHQSSLSSLLATLGPPAIRAYYCGTLASEAALTLVAEENGEIQGFVAGALDARQARRDAARDRPLQTVLGVLLGGLRRPRALAHLLPKLNPWSRPPYEWTGAELLYLAVAPAARGKRVGRALVEAFGQALAQRGSEAYELSVDADNRAARAFYESLGFRPVGRYREFGLEHLRLRLGRAE